MKKTYINKRKKSNKIMAGIVTMMMAFCVLTNMNNVFASNADSNWTYNVSPSNTSYQYTKNNRKKDTNSKFYFKWGKSLNGVTSIYISPVGETGENTKKRVPCTSRFIVSSTGQYRVTNYVYENGYAYANLGIRSLVGTGTVSGAWSPDTQTNYPVIQ
ncbi:MAG: hypothetical protein NC225_09970 [Clostridium sp.]|nr:hypothetical protein [Clostridium sp.]MCM1399790.1 hypothetical protein [Clostridium sp.]MCM1459583.1 hypothetical protein [Bacteroides sp.]